jgi:hypothetical protein
MLHLIPIYFRLNENYARHSDPNLRIEQKVLWASFLSQVVRALPPWESEIFTFMRPNELFALTTEMWGTRLSAESPPPDANGTQRHSFWICGIVARPPKTTQKTHTIQPRNPLMQQAISQDRHTAQFAQPSYPGGPSFSRAQPQSASERSYERAPASQISTSSARSYPPIAQYSSPQAPYTSSTTYAPVAPTVDQRNIGTLPATSPRHGLSGYEASGRPSPSESSSHTAPVPAPYHTSIPNHAQGSSYPPTQRYSAPSFESTRPILPPPPSLNSSSHAALANHTTSRDTYSMQTNPTARGAQQPGHGSAQR